MTYQIYVNAPAPFSTCSPVESIQAGIEEARTWYPDEFVARDQEIHVLDEYRDPAFTFTLADAIESELEVFVTFDGLLEVSYSSNRFQWERTYKAVTKRSWDYQGAKMTTAKLLKAVAAELAAQYPVAMPVAI